MKRSDLLRNDSIRTSIEFETDSSRRDRRGFLAGVVGSLLFGVNATTVVSADEEIPVDENKEVEELTGRRRHRVVSEALSDGRVRQLARKLSKQNLRIDVPSAVTYRATFEDREWRWTRIPFVDPRGGDSERKGGVVWNEVEEVEPFAFVSEKTPDQDAEPSPDVVQAINNSSSGRLSLDDVETTPVVATFTLYEIEDGAVSSETNTRTVPVITDGSDYGSGPSIQSTTSDCLCSAIAGNPLLSCAPCGTWDVDCMLDIAQNWSVEIAACASCRFIPNLVLCGACLAAVLESTNNDDALDALCCWCT